MAGTKQPTSHQTIHDRHGWHGWWHGRLSWHAWHGWHGRHAWNARRHAWNARLGWFSKHFFLESKVSLDSQGSYHGIPWEICENLLHNFQKVLAFFTPHEKKNQPRTAGIKKKPNKKTRPFGLSEVELIPACWVALWMILNSWRRGNGPMGARDFIWGKQKSAKKTEVDISDIS